MPQSRYSSAVPHRTPEYYPEDRENYESVPEVSEDIRWKLDDARGEAFRCRYCEKNIGRSGYCDACIDELDLQEDVRPLTVLTPTTTTNHEEA